MKKIMFNDKYGLTQAVLERRKTMTRRLISDKESTRLYSFYGGDDWNYAVQTCIDDSSRFDIGEEVAVAQSYKTLRLAPEMFDQLAGWNNKMFAKSYWIERYGHRIRITNIKVERLQDISEEDALREGVQMFDTPEGKVYVAGGVYVGEDARLKIAKGMINLAKPFGTAGEAFAVLIDKVSGKGTWESNPWVFVYEFELLNS